MYVYVLKIKQYERKMYFFSLKLFLIVMDILTFLKE